MADTAQASYEQLAQDMMDGNLPVPKDVCKQCTAFGVPFSVNGDSGPRQGDQVLGIPSLPESATDAWLLNNRWIRDKTQNVRDTYLLRVIQQLGADHGDAYLAEFYAFIATQGLEFNCLDDDVAENLLGRPVLDEVAELVARPGRNGLSFTFNRNFRFFDSGRRGIHFFTFTRADCEVGSSEQLRERDEDGSLIYPAGYDWKSVDGLYPVQLAAKQLAQEFEAAKRRHRIWEAIKGAFEVAAAVLAFVPVVGELELGAIGAYKAVRYGVAVLRATDALLAMNSAGDGVSRVISGEGLDVGEKLFECIGQLADPKNGAERGRQVFMVINLAMLTPAAFGGGRWVLRSFRRDGVATARLDTQALSEAERARLQGKQTAEVNAIELRLDKRAVRDAEEGRVTVSELPSVDTNQSLVSVSTQSGRANYAVMSRTLRNRLVLMITQHAGSLKVVGRICKVVGDAGEEALAAHIVERWAQHGFTGEQILGFSSNPAIASRFGLTNKSGHGLDMVVRVPPPPSLTVRAPTTDAMRHSIDGLNGVAPTRVLTFTQETHLVIEVKTTLGGTKTPRMNSTQGVGGAGKVQDILQKILSNRGHWKQSNILEVDPDVMTKVNTINAAVQTRRIEYLHMQVFFDHRGQLNTLVGGGTGIQTNLW